MVSGCCATAGAVINKETANTIEIKERLNKMLAFFKFETRIFYLQILLVIT